MATVNIYSNATVFVSETFTIESAAQIVTTDTFTIESAAVVTQSFGAVLIDSYQRVQRIDSKGKTKSPLRIF